MAREFPPLPRHDLHTHTVWSGHSSPDCTVLNVLAAAAEAGIEAVAVTEHVPRVVPSIEEWRGLKNLRDVLDEVADEVAGIDPPSGAPRLILGAEIDADPFALDGSLMLDDLSGLEYVIASIHVFPGGEAFWYESVSVAEPARSRVLERWAAWLARIAANPAVDAIAHPGALIGARGVIEAFDDECLAVIRPALESMAAYSTAFELNELLGRKLPPAARESYPELVKLARAVGVRFAVGSDAHAPGAVGDFTWIASVARAAGLTKQDFIGLPGAVTPVQGQGVTP
jgi:HisJ family histidinol phosphate phosphatase